MDKLIEEMMRHPGYSKTRSSLEDNKEEQQLKKQVVEDYNKSKKTGEKNGNNI